MSREQKQPQSEFLRPQRSFQLVSNHVVQSVSTAQRHLRELRATLSTVNTRMNQQGGLKSEASKNLIYGVEGLLRAVLQHNQDFGYWQNKKKLNVLRQGLSWIDGGRGDGIPRVVDELSLQVAEILLPVLESMIGEGALPLFNGELFRFSPSWSLIADKMGEDKARFVRTPIATLKGRINLYRMRRKSEVMQGEYVAYMAGVNRVFTDMLRSIAAIDGGNETEVEKFQRCYQRLISQLMVVAKQLPYFDVEFDGDIMSFQGLTRGGLSVLQQAVTGFEALFNQKMSEHHLPECHYAKQFIVYQVGDGVGARAAEQLLDQLIEDFAQAVRRYSLGLDWRDKSTTQRSIKINPGKIALLLQFVERVQQLHSNSYELIDFRPEHFEITDAFDTEEAQQVLHRVSQFKKDVLYMERNDLPLSVPSVRAAAVVELLSHALVAHLDLIDVHNASGWNAFNPLSLGEANALLEAFYLRAQGVLAGMDERQDTDLLDRTVRKAVNLSQQMTRLRASALACVMQADDNVPQSVIGQQRLAISQALLSGVAAVETRAVGDECQAESKQEGGDQSYGVWHNSTLALVDQATSESIYAALDAIHSDLTLWLDRLQKKNKAATQIQALVRGGLCRQRLKQVLALEQKEIKPDVDRIAPS